MNVKALPLKTKPEKENSLRVAAYCRVSSDLDDQLDSLENQKEHYEALIRSKQGWTSAGIFVDEGVSGTGKVRRPGFESLLDACRAGMVDRVLTKSISRFARNTTACLEAVRELSSLGVNILFEEEDIDTSRMESELLLSLLSAVAAAESASISDNLKWGIRKRFQDGTYKISCAPYGYRAQNGKLSVEPGEAETVRKIYSAFLSGKSLSAICRELDEESIPPRKGEKWSVRTVQDILLNPAYIGTAVFQKGFTDDSFHRHKNRGQLPQYEILNHHEPIVSPEMFQAASALLIESSQSPEQPGTFQQRYAFSGRIICGKCGASLKRQKRANGDVSWTCRGHLDHCRCSLMPILDDLLKVAFCTMWNRLRFGAAKVLRPYVDAAEGTGQFNAADALYRAVKGSPPLMAFSDELFLDHVSRILIVSQNIAIFEMKCGLRFRELIPYRQPRPKGSTSKQTTTSELN